jgi:hypothetical protein
MTHVEITLDGSFRSERTFVACDRCGVVAPSSNVWAVYYANDSDSQSAHAKAVVRDKFTYYFEGSIRRDACADCSRSE